MKSLICLVALLVSISVSAQKIQLISGNPNELKGLKSLAVQITYDSLLVGAEIAEADFISTRKKQWDAKEPGKGDEWEKHWQTSKEALYQPAFVTLFSHNSGIQFDPNSPHTMILKINQIEPGWNGGPMGGPAFILGELWIVDSVDPSKVIAVFKLPRYKGLDKNGGDFEMGRRIRQAYVNAAKQIGAYFKNKVI